MSTPKFHYPLNFHAQQAINATLDCFEGELVQRADRLHDSLLETLDELLQEERYHLDRHDAKAVAVALASKFCRHDFPAQIDEVDACLDSVFTSLEI